MGINNFAEELNQGKLKNGQIRELKKLFQDALADDRISTEEIARIQFFYYDSELSVEDFETLKSGVFQQVVQAAIADHFVSQQEQVSIVRIAKQLGVSGEWKQWAQEQIQQHSAPKEILSDGK